MTYEVSHRRCADTASDAEHEEGVRWGPEDTVVLTKYAARIARMQPSSYY